MVLKSSSNGPRSTVLFLDDDPQHFKLYQSVIERGPFDDDLRTINVVPVFLGNGSLKMPEATHDVVALDYRLKASLSAVQIAKQLKSKFPKTAILILSELDWPSDDIGPYSSAFVSKVTRKN